MKLTLTRAHGCLVLYGAWLLQWLGRRTCTGCVLSGGTRFSCSTQMIGCSVQPCQDNVACGVWCLNQVNASLARILKQRNALAYIYITCNEFARPTPHIGQTRPGSVLCGARSRPPALEHPGVIGLLREHSTNEPVNQVPSIGIRVGQPLNDGDDHEEDKAEAKATDLNFGRRAVTQLAADQGVLEGAKLPGPLLQLLLVEVRLSRRQTGQGSDSRRRVSWQKVSSACGSACVPR